MQRPRARSTALSALTALAILLVGCGGPLAGQAPTATAPPPTAAPPAPTATPRPTATPAPPEGLVTTLEDVQLATVQIRSRGTFVEPGELQGASFAGSGSGFIIDPTGIAITNNHVVTGAALIEVFVGGEDRPRNARVLGVSECSDLAVIDIDGDGFSFMQWYAGDATPGLEVYTAGFPLGDPEFTLTKGIVSKARTSGETDWASVERVIEHDATIRSGNSGGPLITKDGQVVAVNFAGLADGPYYAIGRDEALAIVERLRAGEDVTSLGLNGQAIKGDELSGIWVWSVESGSPLDQAGVKPGDFITTLEGLQLATDGTMADYCQILRSRDPGDVLGLQVIRPGTEELLEGQVNGRELAAVGALPTPSSAAPAQQPTQAPAGPAPDESNVVVFGPGEIDVAQARAEADAARGRYGQLVFETFDRGNTTRRSWQEDGDSILRDQFYRLIVREPNTIRDVYWRPNGSPQSLGPDSMLEVDVAFDTGGAVGGVGISFDGQGGGDGVSFIIRSDNSWQVLSFVDGAEAPRFSSEPIPTTAIVDGVNSLRVWRTPEGISLWINNTPVGGLTASPFGGGQVGVAAAGGADVAGPITLIVDNFRALAP